MLVYGGLLGVGSGVLSWFRVSLELVWAVVVPRWDGLVLVWFVWGGYRVCFGFAKGGFRAV